MIDYVKHKPRWRPAKGKDKENLSEGELAFKQIYLSKAAVTYRSDTAKKVDDKFYSCIFNMRKEDAAKEEERLQIMHINSRRDPFQKIFEQNDVSTEIPDFFNNESSPGNDANTAIGTIGGVAGGFAAAASSSAASARGSGRRIGRSMSTPLMKHESPSANLIKNRINTRRSMNASIARLEEDDNETAQLLPSPSINVIAAGYAPQSSRRRSSDFGLGLVGEVGDASIQDHYDDNTSIGDGSYRRSSIQHKWSFHENDDATTNASTLGKYRLSLIHI